MIYTEADFATIMRSLEACFTVEEINRLHSRLGARRVNGEGDIEYSTPLGVRSGIVLQWMFEETAPVRGFFMEKLTPQRSGAVSRFYKFPDLVY